MKKWLDKMDYEIEQHKIGIKLWQFFVCSSLGYSMYSNTILGLQPELVTSIPIPYPYPLDSFLIYPLPWTYT